MQLLSQNGKFFLYTEVHHLTFNKIQVFLRKYHGKTTDIENFYGFYFKETIIAK